VAKDNPVVKNVYALAQRLIPERALRSLKHSTAQKAAEAGRDAGEMEKRNIWPGVGLWKLYRNDARYSFKKAADEIGYEPKIALEQGMQLTGQWARWARLISA
jgi:nucleoside-diphosphate-sugar epimerase